MVLTASDAAIAASEGMDLSEGVLSGTYTSISAIVDSYVLQNHNGIIGFYRVGEIQPTVKAFRAYLSVPASDVKVLYFHADDATNIENLSPANSEGEGVVYDLSGRKINYHLSTLNSQLKKGIYIVNGKKILK